MQIKSFYCTCMQGRTVLLFLGYAMEIDERWAGEAGERAPLSFCPERWLDEAGQKTGAWMPFGGGPRMCLGYLLAIAELKVSFLVFLWCLMPIYYWQGQAGAASLGAVEPWSSKVLPLGC